MDAKDAITLVSGLPRSGTSMMMGMLAAGGMELVIDGIRTADEDNPKGYYEFERIKKIKEDKGWMPDARGKVIKAISQLLLDLPTDGSFCYKIVFMRRELDEVLASQKKMLIRRGTYKPEVSDEDMRRMFLIHLEQVTEHLKAHDCFDTLYVNYNLMLQDPGPRIQAVNACLGGQLDTDAMLAVIDRQLYRNRGKS